MKRNIFVLIFCLSFVNQLFAQIEQINEEWLNNDHIKFINLIKVIRSENYSIDFFKKNINNLQLRENQEIGFGANRDEYVLEGQYIANWFTICSLKDSIFYYKISISYYDYQELKILAQRDTFILNFLSQNWCKICLNPNTGYFKSLDFEYIDENLYTEYKKNVINELGKLEYNNIDSTIFRQYQILISPFEKYDFGNYCYLDGTLPEGRSAIEIIKEKNPNLIKDIMRGYSPEGRIYAIQALLDLVEKKRLELTMDDKLIIEKVLNLKIRIHRCQGCMVSTIFAKDLFNETNYCQILKKNGIIIK